MKFILRISLSLFVTIAFTLWNTSSAGTVRMNFTDGAEYSGAITGKVNFVGAVSADNLTFSGSVTSDAIITGGNVKVASASPFGANIIMNGGALETTAAMNVPMLVINANSTLTADAAATLTGMDGTQKLTIAGTGIVTPADLSGAGAAVDISGKVNFGASAASKLPAADVNVLSGGLAKVMAATADCAPDDMIVQSGGVLEVADSVSVPASGAGDLFGTLKFNTGSTLKLGNSTVWARAITVGVAL